MYVCLSVLLHIYLFSFSWLQVCLNKFSSVQFIYISQGSVATRLWFGGIFNNGFIVKFLEIVSVKEFLKSVNIWRRQKCHNK